MIDYILTVAYFSFPVTKYLVALSNVALQVETQALKLKVKVKFTPEQTAKAQRESRGIALLFL